MRAMKIAAKVTTAAAALALLSTSPAAAAETTANTSSDVASASSSYFVRDYTSAWRCNTAAFSYNLSGAEGTMNCREIYYAVPDTTVWQLWLTV